MQEREKYHEKYLCDDELEIAGFFLTFGNISDNYYDDWDTITFTYGMSDIFDEIYYQKKGIDYHAERDAMPTIINLSEELRKSGFV